MKTVWIRTLHIEILQKICSRRDSNEFYGLSLKQFIYEVE